MVQVHEPGTAYYVTSQQQTVKTTTHDAPEAQRMGEVIDELDSYLCCGLCCYSCGLAATFKNCFGVASETTCCCFEHSCCIKPGNECLWCGCGEGKCQLGLGCCALALVWPSSCCKCSHQLCCLIEHCAFPCGDEMPCVLAFCGLACLPRCGCCPRLNQATDQRTVVLHQHAPLVHHQPI